MDSARKLREVMRRLVVAQGSLDENRRPCGARLSVPHAYVLLELRCDGPMTVSALAERLSIDHTNVSRLCARMESLGELLREPHPDDGRARQLRLTEHGMRLAESVDATSAAHFGRIFAQLEESGEHVIEALGLLVNALARLESQDEEIEE